MNYKYTLNENFEDFKDFLLDIKSHFQKVDTTIHKARNELKTLHYKSLDVVVKSFKTPHLLNRVVYTFFKNTKAQKSYDNAIKLLSLDINTPQPLGYIEFFKNNLLDESYFIAQQFEYDFTIREPLINKEFNDKQEILKAFGIFTCELHDKGVDHKDYSPGNILIKKKNERYIFSIVDINRMEFKELSINERLKNFAKLWASNEDLSIIIRSYAKVASIEETMALDIALSYSKAHKAKINLKKRLKGIEVVD